MDESPAERGSPSPAGEPGFRVLVAGGGVAALEAILALREIGPRLEIELLTDADRFRLAAMSVTTPFGADPVPSVSLDRFCAEQRCGRIGDRLAEIWPAQQRALTESGEELPYDALLVCPGARRRPPRAELARPESERALVFTGPDQVAAVRRLVRDAHAADGELSFEVPPGPCWPLPLYELAMLAAHELRSTRARVDFVTPEMAPLEYLGSAASAEVAELLDGLGVRFRSTRGETPHTSPGPLRVTLPELDVPEIPGLPQGSSGFIPTDSAMRVPGAGPVWAAGDATWFPVKQGGLAATQADVAAGGIGRLAGLPEAEAAPGTFRPVIRAALMTPDGPHYLRSAGGAGRTGRAPLWWPPAKVAGRLLAPYLTRALPEHDGEGLADVDPDAERAADHADAVAIALAGADLDARDGEYDRALRWLEVADALELGLPEAYRERRREWRLLVEAKDGDGGDAASA